MVSFMYLVKAVTIGFAISAPIGPIGLLCIRKTLEQGLIGALYVGAGATLANALFGFIAGTGFSALSGFLLKEGVYLKLFGGAFLLYIAWKEFVTVDDKVEMVSCARTGFIKLSSKSFLLTITNPVAILSFVSIFASISGRATGSIQETFVMIVGIIIGSMAWWLLLGYIVFKVQGYLSKKWLNHIRTISAGIIAWFGIIAILSAW
jgi:putative LysE/RhtB family amino acid efflux pump